MSVLFWVIAAAMLMTAIAMVVLPLKKKKSLSNTPVVLILVFVPITVLGLYAFLGSDQPSARAHAPAIAGQAAGAESSAERPLGSVASMIDGLAARMETEPDDVDGWILLARSYQHIGEHAKAITAYEHAQALGTSDADLEALLFGKQENSQGALAASGSTIRGRIALSPDVASQVLPTDTLFIFAKESRDHRMPVVALRKSASELPIEFALTDAQVMVPGTHIGDYEQLVVTAKISRSGNASDDSLGLEAWSDTISPGSDERIDLLVSTSPGSGNE